MTANFGPRDDGMTSLGRAIAGLAFVTAIIGTAGTGFAHDLIPGATREEPSTTFESLVAEACSPCVKDSYVVSALPLSTLRTVGFGPSVSSMMSRGGEIRIEVVRAYPLGRRDQQFLAMRATLSIKMGDGQVLPVASGLVDEEEVAMFAAAIDNISKTASRRPAEEPIPDTTELEYHAGSLRVGTIRIATGELAYLQAGNVRVLRAPTPFETSSALFFAVSDLTGLHRAVSDAQGRIKRLRGQ